MASNKKNLAAGIVANNPGTSGTSLVLETGYGQGMPETPFFLTLTPPNQLSTIGNSEIVEVTARTDDTMTMTREQKGTTAKDIAEGWVAVNGIYIEDLAGGGYVAQDEPPEDTSLLWYDTNNESLKYYSNSSSEWENVQTSPSSNSWVFKEAIAGVDGTETDFTTARGYIPGTLMGYVNGLAQGSYITETNPATGQFSFDEAPTGDVFVDYQINIPPSGNADTLDGNHLSTILEALYPVGSIFVSGSDTMPSLVANIGTWARIEGRFIVGASDSDGDFDNGDTGGEKEHTLTVAEMPSHSHSTRVTNDLMASSSGSATYRSQSSGGINTGSAGSDAPHNNLPPYKAKYMWERTA